jgi:hypothetical protein
MNMRIAVGRGSSVGILLPFSDASESLAHHPTTP